MQTLTFIVLGPPVPKGRPRMGKGNRVYTPERTRTYEALVKAVAWAALATAKRKGVKWDMAAVFAVDIVAYCPNNVTRDVDNLAKAATDACNGLLWNDDRQIVDLRVRREVDRHRPRLEMTARAGKGV